MAELLFHHGNDALLRLPIDSDRVRIGRGPENDVLIPDDQVSRDVLAIVYREGTWYAVDRTGEGVRVDASAPTPEHPLTDGARIHIGPDWWVTLHLGAPTAPGETRRASMGQTRARPLEQRPVPLRLRYRVGGDVRTRRLEGTISIGADPANALTLPDSYVSAFHARIYERDGQWWIEDQGSTNGTFVGGLQVRSAVLLPGAELRIGETEFLVEEEGAGEEAVFGILTQDPQMRLVLDQVRRVAQSDATVTIFGESGTGKELFARAIHEASPRHRKPFIPVNCAAISKELIESELFGHVRGAFTGAASDRKGAFEEAEGGTIFLDEVGELPLDLQAKLLRVLESREIRRVGSSRPLSVDVRIVAATNRNLHKEVRAGRFRDDLFYRLFVVPLTLPPLRSRKGDIDLLIRHFLETRSPGRTPPKLSPEAHEKLLAHNWPGNVRELKNTIERAILLHRGDTIEAKDITFPLPPAATSTGGDEDDVIHALGKTMAEIEREAIRIHLRANKGNRRLTSETLGMARSTLQTRIKTYGLDGDRD
ncbi:MAG: FHA domain-containing protein [Deltaproteobacteria bacterium]|nr:MAG: FHA domain-containing protein [Deltaproteobacteria bacterium]